MRLEEVEEEFLREGWTEETGVDGAVDTCARSDTPKSGKTWSSEQVGGVLGGEFS